MTFFFVDIFHEVVRYLEPEESFALGYTSKKTMDIVYKYLFKEHNWNNLMKKQFFHQTSPNQQETFEMVNKMKGLKQDISGFYGIVEQKKTEQELEDESNTPFVSINSCNIITGQPHPWESVKDLHSYIKFYKTMQIISEVEQECIETNFTAPGNEGESHPCPFIFVDNGTDILKQIEEQFGLKGIINCYCKNFRKETYPFGDIFGKNDFISGWAWGRDYENSINYYYYSIAVKVGRKNGFLIGLYTYYSLSC